MSAIAFRKYLLSSLAALIPAAILGALACHPHAADPPDFRFQSDPIGAIGHGVLLSPDGPPIEPGKDFILAAQAYYIAKVEKGASGHSQDAEPARIRKAIDEEVREPVLAGALYLDWLIENQKPVDAARLTLRNNALRWRYLLDIEKRQITFDATSWTRGIDPEVLRRLSERGVIFEPLTGSGGMAYVDECRRAGVPVPDQVFSPGWEDRGLIDEAFLETTPATQPNLWVLRSSSPRGACMALPRVFPGTNDAKVLGLICLGQDTSKACFFDNPRGRVLRRGSPLGIDQFVGGVDLVANGQGICSDCHAGENPFVVHRDKPAFAGLNFLPVAWPEPLVAAGWPQNPGPSNVLDGVASPGRCDNCHRVGSAGRFPEISTELAGYCGVVLATAVGPMPKRTMPPAGFDPAMFTAHVSALQRACAGPPTTGTEVPAEPQEDPGFISPPIVIDPIYQCSTRVGVRSTILDARVRVFVNGAQVAEKTARNPNYEEFAVPELSALDRVTASQEIGGVISALSAVVRVRDHRADFPAGLPAPAVDPTLIYRCADLIAVRHVPGANVTIFTNDAFPVTFGGGASGWTVFPPGKSPFEVGDAFTAEAELCGDHSPRSGAERAVAEPASLPLPAFNPATIFPGQQLVTIESLTNGAHTRISENAFGLVGELSTPVSWFPDFDVKTPLGRPLRSGDLLRAETRLCVPGPSTETTPVVQCGALPAPRIRHPRVGDTVLVVTSAVPGARLRIYDDAGSEVGDGSGTVIVLRRPLNGVDTLTVVQEVGDCRSRLAFRVSVRNPV